MENNVKQATNTIKYKFYSTEKPIPWLINKNTVVPEPNISDDWFNFVQLPTTKQFDFDDMTTATIVVGKDTYTYWKVERYTNDVKDKTYYFYTNTILKLLRNSFHIELKLDVYMTYTRNIFKDNVLNNHEFIKINRGSISKSMLMDDDMRSYLIPCMNQIDDNVLNGNDTYSRIDLFRFTDIDKNGNALNKFPINTNKLTINYKYPVIQQTGDSLFNYPSFKHNTNPNENLTYTKGAIQYYDSDSKTTKLAFNYNWLVYNRTSKTDSWYLTDVQRKEIINKYMKLFKLNSINPDNVDEYNKNVMNGYYAVFRNLLGDIDCYPILGKVNANIEIPFWVKSNGLISTATFPSATESDKVVTNKYFWNRIYADNHSDDFVLNNDWDSIYTDLVKNIVNTNVYSNKSFIGIYRGVVPTGKHNNICFDIEGTNYRTGNATIGNLDPVVGEWNIPKRMFYRISYNDFFTFTFGNDELISGFKRFALDKNVNNDLINNSFVELLQPITIGTTEIIPARYLFNINSNELKYTIPFTGTFLDSFQLFLRNGMYNHASYSISLGGTLPTKNEDYENQIKIIEQQKNAGVYSSIGNIVARPLNWFTGSFGIGNNSSNIVRQNSIASKNVINDYSIGYGVSDPEIIHDAPVYSDTYGNSLNKGIAATIGSIGGFIGDGISIYNTIKQSNLAKRNVGPGYITSMTEDLLNAVVHYDNVLDISENDKNLLKQGWFGIGFRKIFNPATKMSYKFHYDNFGFPIDSFVSKDYFKHLFNVLETGDNKTVIYVSFDNDWINTSLNSLSTYNDNLVKSLIKRQLTSGIRMKKFS